MQTAAGKSNPRSEFLPLTAAFVVSTIFGFSFLFTANALEHISPFQLIGFRFLLAAAVLTALHFAGLVKINLRGKPLGELFLLAIFQPGLYFIFETSGIKMTSSSEAGMMIALIPVAVAVLARVVLKESVNRAQAMFIGMSIAGVFIILLGSGQIRLSGHLLGMLLLVGAVISAAVYNILSRRLSSSFAPQEITFVMMWLGAITFNIIGVGQSLARGTLGEYLVRLTHPSVLAAVLYLGLLSSLAAFFLLNYVLSQITASRSAVFANLTTIISVIAGVVFRGEAFGVHHLVGALFILAGVWGTNRFARVPVQADEDARMIERNPTPEREREKLGTNQ